MRKRNRLITPIAFPLSVPLVSRLGMLSDIRYLVRPGIINPVLTFSRAQASGAKSTALAADGVTWVEYAADVPRFQGSAWRLLWEGQRTNSGLNPRCEGAVVGTVGSGGALPTGWGTAGTGTVTVLATGAESGLSYVDLEISGSTVFAIDFVASGVVAADTTQVWGCSFFCKLIGGSLTNVACQAGLTAGGGSVMTPQVDFVPTSSSLGSQRYSNFSGSTGATVSIRHRLRLNGTGAYSVRLRVAAPQLSLASLLSTPILPAVSTLAASTCGNDRASTPLSTIGVPSTGACTILFSGLLTNNAPAGADQILVRSDNNSDSNGFSLVNPAGGATICARRTTSGVASTSSSAGSMTPGTMFCAGLRIDGAGGASVCFNGGTLQSVTGGPTSLSHLRIGNNVAGTAATFGEIARVGIILPWLNDAAFQNIVATFPLV